MLEKDLIRSQNGQMRSGLPLWAGGVIISFVVILAAELSQNLRGNWYSNVRY